MLVFLGQIYQELDSNCNHEVMVFYIDFSKAFEEALGEYFQKVAIIFYWKSLYAFLGSRKQNVRVDYMSSRVLSITSGSAQDTFCGHEFIVSYKNMPDRLIFITLFLRTTLVYFMPILRDLHSVGRSRSTIFNVTYTRWNNGWEKRVLQWKSAQR